MRPETCACNVIATEQEQTKLSNLTYRFGNVIVLFCTYPASSIAGAFCLDEFAVKVRRAPVCLERRNHFFDYLRRQLFSCVIVCVVSKCKTIISARVGSCTSCKPAHNKFCQCVVCCVLRLYCKHSL